MMRIWLATLAMLAVAGCVRDQPERVVFCDVVARRPLLAEYVRVEAVGIFSDHGAVLRHQGCPTLSAQWDEADAFDNDSSSKLLSEAIYALREDWASPTSLDPDALAVDITARYRWRRGVPEFVVERVHSVRRTRMVYANERERDFTRCGMGPLPGPRSDEWHAACDAEEEWFRAERARNNN